MRHCTFLIALVGWTLALGCLSVEQAPGDLETAAGELTSGATYAIKAVHSGKCLDVSGASTADGAKVQQWACQGSPNQSWKVRSVGGVWEIVSVSSGKCLEVAGGSLANRAVLQQAACNGGSNQRWTLTSAGGANPLQIRSVASSKCADVAGVSTADGANLQQWTCGGGGNQKFNFELQSSPGGGGSGGSGGGGGGGGGGGAGCDAPGLVWKTGNKTNYTSYPDPGSVECIEFNGCQWEGLFAACNGKKTKSWVMSHNIVAAFPNFNSLRLHDLCLRSGSKSIVVTVLDTCGDSDCDGCCTQNRGNADALIDIESFTDARWGVRDGRIEWADLGPTKGGGCE